MNEGLKQQVEGLAFRAALEKAHSGQTVTEAEFAALKERVLMRIVEAVDSLDAPEAKPTAKRSKAPRKASEPTAPVGGGKSPAIDSDALRGLLATRMTLQAIAEYFSVSKGVAERAVKALGEAVKSEPGPKEEGKRGKPPTVFWLA